MAEWAPPAHCDHCGADTSEMNRWQYARHRQGCLCRAPERCPRCGKSLEGYTWNRYLGHLGLHGLADSYFDGDLEAAQTRLRENAIARGDPAPWNGAWKQYKPVTVR